MNILFFLLSSLILVLPSLANAASISSAPNLTAPIETETASTSQSPLSGSINQSNIDSELLTDTSQSENELQELVNQFVVVREQPPATTGTNGDWQASITTADLSIASTETTSAGQTINPEAGTDVSNYVVDDTEYEELLRRLTSEAENSITANRANYVADDADMEEIIRLLELEQNSTTVSPIRAEVVSDDISSIYAGGSETSDREACPICLESFKDEEVITTLCSHKFHKKCMESWAIAHGRRSLTCPMCRSSLETPEVTTPQAPSQDHHCQRCFNYVINRSHIRLPCGHALHDECFQRLYRESLARGSTMNRCPTCGQHAPGLDYTYASYWH